MRNRLEEQSRTLEIERSQVQSEAIVHMAAEARAQVQRDAALEQLRGLSDNIQGANVARFELAKVKDQLTSVNNCCTTLNEELAATRNREEALLRENELNRASCVSLVAERNKLETNFDSLHVSAEQQLGQAQGAQPPLDLPLQMPLRKFMCSLLAACELHCGVCHTHHSPCF